jgi:hypothetical protein
MGSYRWARAAGATESARAESRSTSPALAPLIRRSLLGVAGVVFCAVAALAILHIGPAALRDTFPLNLGDPAFTAWAMSWDWRVLVLGHSNPFDANIYWPYHNTLAYSENLIAPSLIYGPVLSLTGSWTLAFNVTTVALLALCFWSTFGLVRWLTGRSDAGLVAAFAFSFGSYVTTNVGHIQLLTLWVLPFAFWQLFRTLETRKLLPAALLGLAQVAMTTSSLYYFAIWLPCAATIVILCLAWSRLRDVSGLIPPLLAAAAASLPAIPVLIPYFQVRPVRPIYPGGGLAFVDFLRPSLGTLAWKGVATRLFPAGYDPEHALFPGLLVVLLALCGLAVLVRAAFRRGRHGRTDGASVAWHGVSAGRAAPRRCVLFLVAAALVAVLLAFGGDVPRPLPSVFRVFHDHVPGFAGIQAPVRFGVVPLLALAALAGQGHAALTTRLPALGRAAVTAVVVLVMGVELASSAPRVPLPTDTATLAVYRELATRPAGAVVELPIGDPNWGPSYSGIEAPRMVYSTVDLHPRVSGYSGLMPPGYTSYMPAIDTFPSPQAMKELETRHVRYVILHETFFGRYDAGKAAFAAATVADLPSSAAAGHYGNAYLIDLEARSRQ